MPAYECPQLPVKCACRVCVHAVTREAIASVEGFDIFIYRLAKRHGCSRPYPNLLEKATRCEFLGHGEHVVRLEILVECILTNEAQHVTPGIRLLNFFHNRKMSAWRQELTKTGHNGLPVHPVETRRSNDECIGRMQRHVLDGAIDPTQFRIIPAGKPSPYRNHG